MSDRYTVSLVLKLLANYAELEAGHLPGSENETGYTDWGTVIGGSRSHRAPFELAKQLKADIDRSLQHLRMTSKFIVTHRLIGGREAHWCAYILKRNEVSVIMIQERAIRKMADFLNGKYNNKNK